MKRLLTLLALFLCCISMSAYNISAVNEDGVTIYYNLINDGTELEVTHPDYHNYSGSIRIPEEVDGKKVTKIGYAAFNYYSQKEKNVKFVSIPGSVKEMYERTFEECSLDSISLSEGLEEIPNGAFNKATVTAGIDLPNSVTTIGQNAFCYFSGDHITMGSGMTTIAKGAFTFNNAKKLNFRDEAALAAWCNVDLPDPYSNPLYGYRNQRFSYVKRMGEVCLNGVALEQLVIPEGVTRIKSYTFLNVDFESVTIPASVETIDKYVFGTGSDDAASISTLIINSDAVASAGHFAQWTTFTNTNSSVLLSKRTWIYHLILGEGVTCIGESACPYFSIFSVDIPNSVTTIGNGAFYNNRNLRSVNIPENVTSIGESAFYGCSFLKSIKIPDGVTTIENYTFSGCAFLDTVSIGNGVKTIGAGAFQDCMLHSIKIPDGVITIGKAAFNGCEYLKSVISRVVEPYAISSDTFNSSVYSSATLYVPVGTKEKYQNTYAWNLFNIVEANLDDFDRPVTITSQSYTIAYGDELPTFEYDSQGITLFGTPKISCEVTSTSPVGTYPIIITKGSVANPNATYGNGTLTIEKAPLTITAQDYTIKQGEALPTFEATYEGFKNNETVDVLTTLPTLSTTATSASEPGEYEITVSGAEAQNYEISYVAGKLTITEADPLVVTAKDYTIEYGDELPAFEFTSEGATIEGSPAITCEATSKSPVGTYPIVITKGSVVNYNDTYVNGTLTITKAPLTITAQGYTIKQGEALPTFEVTYEGFKNEETADVLTTLPTLSTTATSASEPGEYEIAVSGAEAQNYEISYVAGKLTITEASAILNINVEHPVDIYDLQGNKIRSKATSLKGLRKGVYIINGKKVIVK